MNKRKAQWLKRRRAAQLHRQFPVSSGSQHRAIERPYNNTPPKQLKLQDHVIPRILTSKQLREAAPVKPKFGLKMLQKMGWSPGEGLGKNKEGSIEPLTPDGLYTDLIQKHKKQQPTTLVEAIEGKHPVMALTELCTKLNWSAPEFVVVADSGPDHKKNFLMKVIVNGQEFKPSEASSSKKQAKFNAAKEYLQSAGLYPTSCYQPQ